MQRLLLGLGVVVEPQVELLTHCELDVHTFKSNVPSTHLFYNDLRVCVLVVLVIHLFFLYI